MCKNLIIKAIILSLLFISPNLSVAVDYQSMSTEDLSTIRRSLYNAPQEERDAFQTEWTIRMDQMTPVERLQYVSQGSVRGLGLHEGSGPPEDAGVNSGRENAPGRGNNMGYGNGSGGGSVNGSKGGGNASDRGRGNGGNGGGKGRQ